MLVDTERVLLELKGAIAAKSHHGQRDLLALIAHLEVAYQLDEGLPERALRLYGTQFSMELSRPTSQPGCVPDGDGHQDRALRGDSHHESEEDTNGTRRTAADSAGPTAGSPVTAGFAGRA